MTTIDIGDLKSGPKSLRWRRNPAYCQGCRHRILDHDNRYIGWDSWRDPILRFGSCRRLVQDPGHLVKRCPCRGGASPHP